MKQWHSLWRHLRELPAIENFCFYWKTYGGFGALLRSPYIYLAVVITVLCHPIWAAMENGARIWPQIAIDIIPSMLGFSMGGMAIVLAFSTAKIFDVIAEDGAEDSFFITMMGSLFHFILVQSLALVAAICAKAYPSQWLSAVGFFALSYAILVALATAGQLLATARILNVSASNRFHKDDELH